MTVTFGGPKPGSLSAKNSRGVRTYGVTYKLHATEGETAAVVGNNASLPSIGSIHAEDGLAYCDDVDVKQVAGKNAWEASVSWTTQNSVDGDAGLKEDPEQDRPLITWNGSVQNISIYKDRDGEGILNSAGDPLMDVKDTNLLGVTISSNVTGVPSYILSYRDSINDAAINVGGLAIAAGVARIVFPGGFISPAQTRGNYTYYTFSYELIFDEQESHTGQLLDQGYNERFTDVNTANGLRPIVLENKTLATEPQLLDGSGKRLEDPTPETASYVTVNKYFQKDFSVLPGVTAQ